MQIGIGLGLRVVEIGEMLNSDLLSDEVNADIRQAATLGIQGVPFFVFDNKYAISGAQPVETFRGGLQQAWAEYEAGNKLIINEGDVCTPGGNCETKN